MTARNYTPVDDLLMVIIQFLNLFKEEWARLRGCAR